MYPMPASGFPWATEEEWQQIDWLAQREDQYTGYFVECDLEYPTELHNAHNDYPLAAQKVAVIASVLSEKYVELARQTRGVSHRRMSNSFPVYSTRCGLSPTT